MNMLNKYLLNSTSSIVCYAPPSDAGALNSMQIAVVGNLRDAFKESEDRDCKLDDATILAINDKVDDGKRGDDNDLARIVKMLEGEKIEEQQSKDAQDQSIAWAAKIAVKANTDEEFLVSVRAYIEADEIRKRGCVPVLMELERIYSKDELNAFPIVGSGPAVTVTNRKVDRYKIVGQAAYGSRIRDFAMKLQPAVEASTTFTAIKERTGAYADQASWPDEKRNTHMEFYKNKFEKTVQLVRDAFRVHQAMQACNEMVPGKLVVRYDTAEGVLADTVRPIIIANKEDGGQWYRAAKAFVKLDGDAVAAVNKEATIKGGTLKAFLNALLAAVTPTKEPTIAGDKAKDEAKVKQRIETMPQYEEHLAAMASAHNNKDFQMIYAKHAADPSLDDAFVLSWGDLLYSLLEYRSKFDGRYLALKDDIAEAKSQAFDAEQKAKKAA